eukprot:3459932-Rhodomonas_salina.1
MACAVGCWPALGGWLRFPTLSPLSSLLPLFLCHVCAERKRAGRGAEVDGEDAHGRTPLLAAGEERHLPASKRASERASERGPAWAHAAAGAERHWPALN